MTKSRGLRPRLTGRTVEEKLRLNHDVDQASACWRWTGAHTSNGYGIVRVGGPVVKVHRLAYEVWVGPIPAGLQIDHVLVRGCVHRDCINPAHLEAVTPSENTRRGSAGSALVAMQAAKTHCPKGHPYSGDNLYEHKGKRYCLACKRDRRARV